MSKMDFERFVEEVKSRIKNFLPEKYANAEIYVHEQKKNKQPVYGFDRRSWQK